MYTGAGPLGGRGGTKRIHCENCLRSSQHNTEQDGQDSFHGGNPGGYNSRSRLLLGAFFSFLDLFDVFLRVFVEVLLAIFAAELDLATLISEDVGIARNRASTLSLVAPMSPPSFSPETGQVLRV